MPLLITAHRKLKTLKKSELKFSHQPDIFPGITKSKLARNRLIILFTEYYLFFNLFNKNSYDAFTVLSVTI